MSSEKPQSEGHIIPGTGKSISTKLPCSANAAQVLNLAKQDHIKEKIALFVAARFSVWWRSSTKGRTCSQANKPCGHQDLFICLVPLAQGAGEGTRFCTGTSPVCASEDSLEPLSTGLPPLPVPTGTS